MLTQGGSVILFEGLPNETGSPPEFSTTDRALRIWERSELSNFSENGEPATGLRGDSLEELALRNWLLFQIVPQLIHQLRNHMTVAQNAHFALKKAIERNDTEKTEKASELGILGFQRAEGGLKTIALFDSGSSERILDHYRSRFSNSEISLEFPIGESNVDELLPALVYSLEHLRTRMVKKSRLIIRVSSDQVIVEQFDSEAIVPPPVLSDSLKQYFQLQPSENGWEIQKRGQGSS